MGPLSSRMVHGGGDQAAAAFVLGRDVMFPSVDANVTASSTASPWIASDVASELVSSVWNCT